MPKVFRILPVNVIRMVIDLVCALSRIRTCAYAEGLHFSAFILLFLLEEAYLNNHKINEFESLHVEIYHYVLGNRGIIFR